MTDASLGRLRPLDGQPTMKAVVTMGHGGYDQLVYCEVARPAPGPTEVLVQVRAAGMNNTEINTRLGWYSSSVKKSTEEAAETGQVAPAQALDGGLRRDFPLYLDLVPSRLLSWDVSGQVAACPDTAVLSPVSPRMEPSWKAWDQDRLSRTTE